MADNAALRGKKVWARRPFGYAGQEMAEGEIFPLQGHRNDHLLLRFRYVDEVPSGKKHHEHGDTGRKFMEAGYLEQFGRSLARQQEDLTILEAGMGLHGFLDATGDAEQRRLDQVAPLDLSKTEASQR